MKLIKILQLTNMINSHHITLEMKAETVTPHPLENRHDWNICKPTGTKGIASTKAR